MMDSDDGPLGAAPLRIILSDIIGRPIRDPGVGAWLREVAPASARGMMGLVLAGDGSVRRLNREFAGEDHATDVLSFPARSGKRGGRRGELLRAGPGVGSDDGWLGDIVIATGVARRQARAAGHSMRSELRLLALHGLLHLLGFDHETDGGKMARLEKRLRRRGGLGTSLTERGGGARASRGGRRS
jgi:probable rRNA maturation factor